MKKHYLIYILVLLGAVTSCKKDSKQDATPVKPVVPVIAAVGDSVSYTIDGKTYTIGGFDISQSSSGGEDANRKLTYPDSTKKNEYALVGPQDSVMFFQKYGMYSTTARINFYFFKKYTRQTAGLYWMPGQKDVLTLFTVGNHPLAEDFEWQNTQNGMAIDVAINNAGYSSYNAYDGVSTVVIPPGFQKNSTFEITSFKQVTSEYGGYNLEAKFTAFVYNAAGQQKKLENGYLRLYVNPYYNALAN